MKLPPVPNSLCDDHLTDEEYDPDSRGRPPRAHSF
jgi:hypothetical protein